jgi:hypothetical protein
VCSKKNFTLGAVKNGLLFSQLASEFAAAKEAFPVARRFLAQLNSASGKKLFLAAFPRVIPVLSIVSRSGGSVCSKS